MGEDRKTAREVKQVLKRLGNPERAKFSLRYFKTGAGQYGEGDKFLGISAPNLRKTARLYQDLETDEILKLLHSSLHEERVLALLIWNHQFQKGSPADRQKIHRLYLKNSAWINNWDLVDCSAEIVIGKYLLDKNTRILEKLAASKSLWQRRIAMISTFAFIREKRFDLPLRIARRLIHDTEDLIHKASGWMLREIGKRDSTVLEQFLAEHATKMPRTMLRYSIEKFPEIKRKKYLSIKNVSS
jgi:3-methyladenine DNA glycosylase AlkD